MRRSTALVATLANECCKASNISKKKKIVGIGNGAWIQGFGAYVFICITLDRRQQFEYYFAFEKSLVMIFFRVLGFMTFGIRFSALDSWKEHCHRSCSQTFRSRLT